MADPSPAVAEALRTLNHVRGALKDKGRRAFYRIGHTVLRTARQYAPISPSVALMRRFLRTGAGILTTKGSKLRLGQTVVLTRSYASRLSAYTPKRGDRRTSRPKPGGLMRSLWTVTKENEAKVLVPANSEAGRYAYTIHEEKGIRWRLRGPGTQAKGAKADHKFISRAITDHGEDIVKILDEHIAEALA